VDGCAQGWIVEDEESGKQPSAGFIDLRVPTDEFEAAKRIFGTRLQPTRK
jgi:hypothetical protein